MKKLRLSKKMIGFSMVFILLFGLPTAVMGQDPRPTVPVRATPTPGVTVDPTATPSAGGTTSSSKSASSDSGVNTNCASVYGVALNWGYGNQSNVGLQLANDGWHIDQLTAGNGDYRFGNLGTGVGILTVKTAEDTLTPMVNEAAVRLTCDFPTHANIGLYSGKDRPETPATISLSASEKTLKPGQSTTIMLKVKNNLPTDISHAIITDLFPKGLSIESATSSMGTVEIIENKMLTVMLGDLPSGAEESVAVTVKASRDLESGTKLHNAATFFYAESAADQSDITFLIGKGSSTVATQAQANTADTNANPVSPNPNPPAPDTLPVTGLGISFSFVGLIIIIIALVSRGTRSIKRREF